MLVHIKYVIFSRVNISFQANRALNSKHNKKYTVGCIPCLLYTASGGSIDWAYGTAGIPYSFGLELRDDGTYGFLLPPSQIIPTGEEIMAFHVSIAHQMIKEFGNSVPSMIGYLQIVIFIKS